MQNRTRDIKKRVCYISASLLFDLVFCQVAVVGAYSTLNNNVFHGY